MHHPKKMVLAWRFRSLLSLGVTLFVVAMRSADALAAQFVSNQAQAVAVVLNGFVVGINVTWGGNGYLTPPPVTIVGTGANAQAEALVQDGKVVSITVTNAGSGYDTNTQVLVGPSSFPDITAVQLYVGITVNAQVGSTVDIQRAPSLQGQYPWSHVLTASQTVNPQVFFDPLAPGQSFYRVLPVPTNPNPSQLVWIPAGTFMMGSPPTEAGRAPDEQSHQVSISQGFWIARREAIQSDYLLTMLAAPSQFTNSGTLPVDSIAWQEAINYCDALTMSEQSAGRLPPGYTYRLPTEAEWEYAARFGSQTPYSFGQDPGGLPQFAWFASNSMSNTHPVASRSATPPSSLFDIYGNVAEWCLDWYGPLSSDYALDPQGPTNGTARVVRGGGWASSAAQCRSAARDWLSPTNRSASVGFRVVLAAGVPTLPTNPNPAKLVWIPPGTFLMGSPLSEFGRASDETQHSVTLSKGFWLSKYKLTEIEFSTLTGIQVGSSPNSAAGVSWLQGTQYCQMLTQQESQAGRLPAGYRYRLPTEAEWEFAARAGTQTRYFFGDDLDGTQLWTYAWYGGNCGGTTLIVVGEKVPSPIGLYDIYGYAQEWCFDWYGAYPAGPVIDPRGPASGPGKVLRGGCCMDLNAQCRSAARRSDDPAGGSCAAMRVVLGPN